MTGPAAVVAVMGTAFTYQGQLIKDGEPVTDNCDFLFILYDAPINGSPVGDTQEKPDVTVTGGLFTVPNLDFGSGIFTGEARWLATLVRCPINSGAYTAIGPRQELSPTPYALHAGHATLASTAAWNGLIGVPAGFAENVDNDTTYTTDYSLALVGTQLSIAPTYRLPQGCSAADDIARWNDATERWECSQDEGDITGVIADVGLTGTACSGEATIDAQFGGTGSSTYIARSDHNHWGAAWTGSGTGLSLSGGSTGVHTDGSAADLDLGGDAGKIVANDAAGANLELYSNAELIMHLDDDNNSGSAFTVYNGANTSVFSVDENGELTFGSWAARTSYLSAPPSAFDGEDNSVTLVEEDGSFRPASTGGGIYRAPLYLPHGATLTRLTWYWATWTSTTPTWCGPRAAQRGWTRDSAANLSMG